MTTDPARSGPIREIAQTLCVLVVVNGALLCMAARLSRHAPLPFLAQAFDLLNTALAPTILAMMLAALAAALLRPALGLWLTVIAVATIAWQLAAVLADVAPRSPVSAGGQSSTTTLRMVTLNAFHDNSDPARMRAVIEAAAPDIVAVEEANGSAGGALLRMLPGFWRVTSCGGPVCSITVLSRWPAVRVDTPMPGEPHLPDMLYTRIAVPAAPHSPAALHSPAAIDVVAVHLPRGYRPVAARFRALVLGALRDQRAGPVILAGDFNLPTGAAALHNVAVAGGLTRADRWIATYPANRAFPAFAAIDHIFVDRAFGVRECRRLPFAGSDHYGLVCDIVLPPRGRGGPAEAGG